MHIERYLLKKYSNQKQLLAEDLQIYHDLKFTGMPNAVNVTNLDIQTCWLVKQNEWT